MTKKHFIALADAIRSHNAAHKGKDKFSQIHLDTLATFCMWQNSRFMRGRWLSYIAGECGSNGGALKKAKPRKPVVCDDCLGIDSHEANCLKQTEVRR